MSANSPYLMWFRQDLRLVDNTALYYCCEEAQQIDCGVVAVVYLTPNQWQSHQKSWWQIDLLLRQINVLKTQLADLNIHLWVRVAADFTAQAQDLLALCQRLGCQHVFANREYELNEYRRDNVITQTGTTLNPAVDLHLFDDQCIVAPKRIVTGQNTSYKVFTPYYKRWLAHLDTAPPELLPVPTAFDAQNYLRYSDSQNSYHDHHTDDKLTMTDFVKAFYSPLTPTQQALLAQVAEEGKTRYEACEQAALGRLEAFLSDDIFHYATARDVPSMNGNAGATSQLSYYLALGMISARLCYHQAWQRQQATLAGRDDCLIWISELAWRDFYRDIIVNRPDIVQGKAFLTALDQTLAWRYDEADFLAWCQGKTGVPLVDAAMRCLNSTGFMHNRLRMVTAMYLTKNLLIDWRWGEAYFMQHLVDGDFANNNAGWQWSASIGTDAAPYFRMMNPFSQAKTYDKAGLFIRQWLPELADIPLAVLHDEAKLQRYLVAHPQIDYPAILINHQKARELVMTAFRIARQALTALPDESV